MIRATQKLFVRLTLLLPLLMSVFTLQFVTFVVVSCVLLFICRRQLTNPRCHGFYRFFALEGILALALLNLALEGRDLFTPLRLLSGLLMTGSLVLVVVSLQQLKQGGKDLRDDCPENFTFENTVQLVNHGIYQYVRHPMYTSLLLLGWGVFLQDPSWLAAVIALEVTLMLICTIRVEEQENRSFFGEAYVQYQQSNKMLIPFVL